MKHFSLLAMCSLAFLLTSCNAKNFYNETYADTSKQMTLGTAQKELRKGMTQDEVAAALGSPNIVSKDKEGKEAWIYDKISTQVRSSGASGWILSFQTGADYVKRSDVSQQTLTVIVKFDGESKVDNVSYHASKF